MDRVRKRAAEGNPTPQPQQQPALAPAQTPQQSTPPQQPPKRTATVWESTPNSWVLTISSTDHLGVISDTHYRLVRVHSDWGLRLYLHHLPAVKDAVYLVDLCDQPTCDCPSFSRRKACKHLQALLALQKQGRLDAFARSKEGQR